MTYLINYNVTFTNGNTEYAHTIKVKNQDNELFAKINLENYLRKKFGNSFYRLEVVGIAPDNDILSMFNNIFNGKV